MLGAELQRVFTFRFELAALSSAEASFVHLFRAVVAAGLGPGEREKRQRAGNARSRVNLQRFQKT